jgi:hypothetical protein
VSNVSLSLYFEPGAPAPAIGASTSLLDVRVGALFRDGPTEGALPGDHAHAYTYGNPFGGYGQERVEL